MNHSLRVLLGLVLMATYAAGGTVLNMPYYDVEIGTSPYCAAMDHYTVRCGTGDTYGRKDGGLTLGFTLTYTAHPGYVLTSLYAEGYLRQYAGVGVFQDYVDFNLAGHQSTDGPFQNVVYWQNSLVSPHTGWPPLSIEPTTSATVSVTYRMRTYDEAYVEAGEFRVHAGAQEGTVATPEPGTLALVCCGVLAGFAAIRRRRRARPTA